MEVYCPILNFFQVTKHSLNPIHIANIVLGFGLSTMMLPCCWNWYPPMPVNL